jgi:hypothetical protein
MKQECSFQLLRGLLKTFKIQMKLGGDIGNAVGNAISRWSVTSKNQEIISLICRAQKVDV